jgi:hypothetical protein
MSAHLVVASIVLLMVSAACAAADRATASFGHPRQ